MNLLAMTPCCVDFYPQLNKSFPAGNSLNVASMWKTLVPDENVSVISCLGNDRNAEMIKDFLRYRGINASRVYSAEGATACNQLRVDENGERFGIEGAWNGGVYETFRLSESDWQFAAEQDIVAIPANNPNFINMLKKKHKHQLISVDYLDVENHLPIYDTVELTDIAFISADTDLLAEYRELAFSKNILIVVTAGADGSYAYQKGQSYYQPALEVDKVVDTTGCGDAYQAAFALTFYKTKSIEKSMLAGARAASVILKAWGGAGKY